MTETTAQSLADKLAEIQEAQFDSVGSFAILDISYKYRVCNREALNWVGLSQPEDLIGKSIEETPWAPYKDQFADHNQQVYQTNQPQQFFEYHVIHNELITAVSQRSPFYHNGVIAGIAVRSLRIPYQEIHYTRPLCDETVFVDTRNNQLIEVCNRRRESLYLLLLGHNFKEIGEHRHLSTRTIEHHIEHIRVENNYTSIRELMLYVQIF